jgi:antitoxin ParD1/3/4
MTSMNTSVLQDVREPIRGDQKLSARERLDALLLEGLNSGEPLPATPVFWRELKREALKKVGKKTRR